MLSKDASISETTHVVAVAFPRNIEDEIGKNLTMLDSEELWRVKLRETAERNKVARPFSLLFQPEKDSLGVLLLLSVLLPGSSIGGLDLFLLLSRQQC